MNKDKDIRWRQVIRYFWGLASFLIISCTLKAEDKPVTAEAGVIKSAVKMENTFPFSGAAKVEVISFPSEKYSREAYDEKNYKIHEGKLNFDDSIIIDRIILNTEQRKALFNLLYSSNVNKEFRGADCYRPNHRILFYDNDNNIIAFLEVCLSCEGYKTSLGFEPEELLHNKFIKLEAYFRTIGVKHFEEY